MSAQDKFAKLSPQEWRGLMTPAEREAHAQEIREAEARGYTRGYFDRGAECAEAHGAIANRIDAAARAFYLLEASDFHRDEVGA